MFKTFRTRIYSAPPVINDLADSLNSGFIIQGQGIWLGIRENAAVLEVVADGSEVDRLITRAIRLADRAGEDSILATALELNAAIVTTTGERLPVVGSIMETFK